MKYLLLIVAVGAVSCNSEDPPPPPGNLRQPAGALIVGDRLFISSSPEDGLRVVDLAGSTLGACSVERDCREGSACVERLCTLKVDTFVRGPNPLFALVVPTVRRPGALVAVVGSGRTIVASLSAVDPQLRLVDADGLVPLGDPVGLPGRPVDLTVGPDGVTLYVAIESASDGSAGAVIEVTLDPEVLDGSGVVGSPATILEWSVDALPGGIAVVDTGGGLEAWVSDSRTAEVVRLLLPSGAQERRATGSPLGRLVASPAASDGGVSLAAGRWVYGLTIAGRGVVAIDTTLGEVDSALIMGGEILPVLLPAQAVGLVATPLALVDVVEVLLDGTTIPRTPLIPILLVVPLADGRVTYLDGVEMAPVDLDGDRRADPLLVSMTPASEFLDAPRIEGGVSLNPGVTRTRTWSIVYRGLVPKQRDVLGTFVFDGDVVRVRPSSLLADLADRVEANDLLYLMEFESPPAGCEPFATAPSYRVAGVDGVAGEITIEFDDRGLLPTEACFRTPFTYQVRAGTGQFVVEATDIDTPMRARSGEAFSFAGRRFAKTTPLVDAPEIRFSLEADQTDLAAGDTRTLKVVSGLESVIVVLDSANLNVDPPSMPGQPAIKVDLPGVPSGGRVYVPYAGSGYLWSYDLKTSGSQAILR